MQESGLSVAEIYRRTRKVPDAAWNLYVARPIAAVVVQLVRGTPITPNQITLLSFVVAVASFGALAALPGHAMLILAVVAYELSYVLDCADGMLARFRSVQSTAGHLLDFLMDELKAFVMVAAVATRLFLERGDETFLLLGLGGLVCLATGTALTTFQRRPEIAGPARDPASGDPSLGARGVVRRVVGLVERVAKLLIHYPSYIWVAAIANRLDLFLYAYVGVNGLYAARTLASVFVRHGRPNPK